ncbi:hypothetical protein CBL_01607 [Carabus blaptoides fortunei]
MKRAENFHFINKAKKQKIEHESDKKENDDDDDIWGDDPEIEELDKCIDLATQLCSQNTRSETGFYPTYDEFRQKDIYSSTQAFILPAIASTSKFEQNKQLRNYLNSSSSTQEKCTNVVVTKDISEQELRQQLLNKIKALEIQNKKLKENYETKDGEIAILRSQLKQASKTIDHEKMQKLKILEENQEKWTSKFNVASKDLTQLKCEVELKNLEIVNLREKICETKKVYSSNLNMSILSEEMNISQSDILKRNNVPNASTSKDTETRSVQTIQPDSLINTSTFDDYLPFKSALPNYIYENCEQDMSVITIKQDPEEYLKTFEKSDKEISLVPFILTESGKRISMDYLHPDIYALVQLNVDEVNSSKHTVIIKRILFVTIEHLVNMQVKLKTVDELMHERDLEEIRKFYLLQKADEYPCDCIFSGKSWVINEAWPETRRCLAITTVVVTYCKEAFKYISGQLNMETAVFDFTELRKSWQRLDVYPEQSEEEEKQRSPTEFLEMLVNMTTIIEKIRRGHQFCGLLASILKLLSALCEQEKLPPASYDLIFEIFKNIVFSRPPRPVIKYISEFLQIVSSIDVFMVKLCHNSPSSSFGQEEKQLYYFTKDTCVFQILSKLIQYSECSVESLLQVIQCLNNAVMANVKWCYYIEDQKCECLLEVYALTVTSMYNCMKSYLNRKPYADKLTLRIYHAVFELGFIFLNILTTRAPMLVYRRLDVNKEYQIVIRRINELKENLNFTPTDRLALENTIIMLDGEDDSDCEPLVQAELINTIQNIFLNDE